MPIEKLPGGTRGPRNPPRLFGKLLMPLMTRIHRRQGDRFRGTELLYLTTVGARSGERRTNPVARIADGDSDGWIIVASVGGAVHHPGWYHNVCAHPDQVWAEVAGVNHRVEVEQLTGEARERAWAKVIAQAPSFQGYVAKTDRQLPVLRLTPAP